MFDAAYSRKLQLDHAAVRSRRQLIIPLVAAFILIGGGGWTVWANASKAVAQRASDELLETTKGLEFIEQQAIDQLQIAQDQLVARRTETKSFPTNGDACEKLDALRRSIANLPAPSVAAPVTQPKAQASKK